MFLIALTASIEMHSGVLADGAQRGRAENSDGWRDKYRRFQKAFREKQKVQLSLCTSIVFPHRPAILAGFVAASCVQSTHPEPPDTVCGVQS